MPPTDRVGPGLGAPGFDLGLSEEVAYGAEIYRTTFDGSRSADDPSDRDLVWTLPGQGQPCGRPPHPPTRWRLCPSNHAVPFLDTDDRRDCPTCWRKGWMAREAGHVLTVLRAESDGRRGRGDHYRVVHASVNPPPALWNLADDTARRPRPNGKSLGPSGFDRLRAAAYRVAREAGLRAGAVIFHRTRCADREDPVETDGPHFHVIGFGWIEGDTFCRTGWVVKNHGLRLTAREVRGTAAYVLSHSARLEPSGGILREGKSEGATLTVTWFGRSVRASEIETEGPFCPICVTCYPLNRWLSLEWAGQGPPPDGPVVVDWSEWRAYALDSTGTFGRGARVSVVRSDP